MDLRTYVERILRGHYAMARADPPRWARADLDELAESAHDAAQRPQPFPAPGHLAVALGARVVPRAPARFCGEGTALGVVCYRWAPDAATRGLRILHGLAHVLLHRTRDASTEADAWILTASLAVPRSRLTHARVDPDAASRHLPEWLVVERLIESRVRKAQAV
ncbi:MAG TPA: hypothetical protein VHH11_13995 [Gammaproteobacteria bacterium]|nr:hypothetical protein [Gammaproteobacteria bacterium]